jgi:RHS repeat-associated protein
MERVDQRERSGAARRRRARSVIRATAVVAVVLAIVRAPQPVGAQPGDGDDHCSSPDYPCDNLSFCTPCPLNPPPPTYTGNGEEIAPYFAASPGAERAAHLLGTWFPAFAAEFDYGGQPGDYDIEQSEIDEWADEAAGGFDQSELPGDCELDAFERQTQPAFPIPTTDGIEIPLDQGAPRSPDEAGSPNDNEEAKENADPVNPANGELYIEHTDLAFPGFGVRFALERTYRSRIDYTGVLGPAWDFNYNQRLLNVPDSRRRVESTGLVVDYESTGALPHALFGLLGDPRGAPSAGCGPQVVYMTGHGTTLRFRQVGENDDQIYYESAEGVRLVLSGRKRSGGVIDWSLTEPDGTVQRFDELGLLTAITDANGIGVAVDWEENGQSDWRVATVTDSVGRVIDFEYNTGGRIVRVWEATSGLEARYTYQNGRLASATDSSGRTEHYEYDFDATRVAGDWGPEGYLVPACELACAPSGSSCDAGGACDEPVRQATAQCMGRCGACGISCFFSECPACLTSCSGSQPGTPSCRSQCQTQCESQDYEPNVTTYCNQAWGDHGRSECRGCEDECEQADRGCHIARVCLEVGGAFGEDGEVADPEIVGACLTEEDIPNIPELISDSVQVGIAGFLDFLGCAAAEVCDWIPFVDCADCSWERVKDQVEDLCEQNYRQCCRDGNNCADDSCNEGHSCFDDCHAAFMGVRNDNDCAPPIALPIYNDVDDWAEDQGCVPRLTEVCANRCTSDCVGDCTFDCIGVCGAACAEACHSGDCAGYCDSLDLMGSCQTGCVDGCVQAAHEKGPYVGAKYGYPRDLNNNIIRIRNGEQQIYLEVDYGQDISRPDFDAVIAQTYGDFSGQIYYRDLDGEERGHVDPPTSGPAADFIDSRAEFQPVEICPSACSPVGNVSPYEYVPTADRVMVQFASGPSITPGGLSVQNPRGQLVQIAPNVLLLSRTPGGGLHALSTAERLGAAPLTQRIAPFDVNVDGGRATFAPAGNRSFSVRGPAAALDSLFALEAVTVFTDGAGRLRVYPGHPNGLIRMSSGTCREPFRAQVTGAELRITPTGACSPNLAVAPLATAKMDLGTKGNVSRDGRRVLDGLDMFEASAMVPNRQPLEWRMVPGGPGRYTAYQGTDAPGGDLHRAATLNAGMNLPLSTIPTETDMRGPLFVYHDTTNVLNVSRNAPGARNIYYDGADDLILDAPLSASDPASMICTPARPGPVRRGEGVRPTRATVMVDFYGVAWTYYFDQDGRVIRSVNNSTAAVRSTNYDSAGQVDGVEGPQGQRTCFNYDEYGNVLDAFDFPQPGALGRTEPVRYRYAWDVDPVRLKAIFDPRGTNLFTRPSVVLQSFEYDGRGNLRRTVNAAGEEIRYEFLGGDGPARFMVGRRFDPDGEPTKFEYDESTGGIERMLVGAGRVDEVETQIVYDPAGRPVWHRSSLGEETTFDYEGGRLASISRVADDLTETTILDHDDNSQLILEDRGDRQTTYAYDVLGGLRRVRNTAVDGSAPTTNRCTRYGPSNRLLEEVSPEGNRVRYTYDGEGRVTLVEAGSLPSSGTWDDGCPSTFGGTAAAGAIAQTTYDVSGRPTQVLDARQLPLTVQYDGFGRPAIVTDGEGTNYRTGYDEIGNILWRSSHAAGSSRPYGPPPESSPDLTAEDFAYDEVGRQIQHRRWHWSNGVAVGDGFATTLYDHDASTHSVAVTDDSGAVTNYMMDPAGRLIRIDLPGAASIISHHLEGGRSIQKRWHAPTPSGLRHETTTLTAWGAVDSVTTTDVGATPTTLSSFDYDAHRRLVSATDAAGLRTTMAYDAMDRPTTQTVWVNGVASETVVHGWNRNDWLLTRSSSAGGAQAALITFGHDALGRLRRRVDPVGAVVTTDYVLQSSAPSVITDERSITKTFSYDDQGNVTQVVADGPDGSQQLRIFMRDSLGRPNHTRRYGEMPDWAPSGIDTYLLWDSLGNRVSERNDNSGIAGQVVHDYTGRGLIGRSVYGNDDRIIHRGYDELGRLKQVNIHPSVAPLVTFTYPRLGPVTHRQDVHNGPTNGTTYEYDALGRLERMVTRNAAGQPLVRQRWEIPLDDVPRVAGYQWRNQSERASVFTADDAGRLRSETHALTGLTAVTVAPDANTSAANTTVQPHVGTGSSWSGYTLDGRHNFSSVSAPGGSFSPTVNLADEYSNYAGRTLTHDDDGSLLSDGVATFTYDLFGDLSSVDAGAAGKRTYIHDAFGRIAGEHDDAIPGSGGTTRYGLDGWRRHFRQLPDGTTHIMVDGQGLDEHLVRLGGTAYMYHQDRQGSVHLLTDLNGNAAEFYRYSAYGDVTIESPTGEVLQTSAVGNQFGYQGHAFDKAVGLVDMRNRTYRPSLGRFLTRDPIGLAGGTNLYAFVDSSPLRFIDPFGLEPQDAGAPDAGVPTPAGSCSDPMVAGPDCFAGTKEEYCDAYGCEVDWAAVTFNYAPTAIIAIYTAPAWVWKAVAIYGMVTAGDHGEFAVAAIPGGRFKKGIGAVDDGAKGLAHLGDDAARGAGVVGAADDAAGAADDAARAAGIPAPVTSGATFGAATSNNYRKTFFSAHPELEGQVVVHHAVEQQVLKRYPNVATEAEIHSLENLRGIPNASNPDLHLSKIRREWNQFYRQNPNPTKEELLRKATEIDEKFGSQFNPPR